jgi:hypothetical protein
MIIGLMVWFIFTAENFKQLEEENEYLKSQIQDFNEEYPQLEESSSHQFSPPPEEEHKSHPLWMIKKLGQNTRTYLERWRTKISDIDELGKLEQAVDSIDSMTENFSPEDAFEVLHAIPALKTNYFLDMEEQLNLFVQDINQTCNTLALVPDKVLLIREQTAAILKILDKMTDLADEFDAFEELNFEYENCSFLFSEALSKNDSGHKHMDEIHPFISRHFSNACLTLLEPLYTIVQKELHEDISAIIQIIQYGRATFLVEDYQKLQKLQRATLEKMRKYYSFFSKLYQSFQYAATQMVDSALLPTGDQSQILISKRAVIENELLPICEHYAEPIGKMDSDFNNTFKKVLDCYNAKSRRNSISIGPAESATTFLEERQRDLRFLLYHESIGAIQNVSLSFYQRLKKCGIKTKK